MTNLRKQARGPRFVAGEKRCVTVRASVTPSLADRSDAWCRAMGITRSRLVEMGTEHLVGLLDAGQAPSGPVDSWRFLLLADLADARLALTQAEERVLKLELICQAAGHEAAEVELSGEPDHTAQAA